MSGKNAVLDSNVIINCAKKIISFKDILSNYDILFVSIITYVESLGFKFDSLQDKIDIEDILKVIPNVFINQEIADIAIEYRKRKKIKLPDAFILASAKYQNADLITSNTTDFTNIDDTVNIIKPIISKI